VGGRGGSVGGVGPWVGWVGLGGSLLIIIIICYSVFPFLFICIYFPLNNCNLIETHTNKLYYILYIYII